MSDLSANTLITDNGLALSLRLLSEEDIPAVMMVEHAAHSHPWRKSSFEDCLKGRHRCWLAEHKSKVVGYVVFTFGGGDSELLNISVAPKWQRRGVGRALVQFALDSVKTHADMMFLEVRVSNQKAIELYYRLDFFEVGQRRNYYPTSNGREDALLMACQLA